MWSDFGPKVWLHGKSMFTKPFKVAPLLPGRLSVKMLASKLPFLDTFLLLPLSNLFGHKSTARHEARSRHQGYINEHSQIIFYDRHDIVSDQSRKWTTKNRSRKLYRVYCLCHTEHNRQHLVPQAPSLYNEHKRHSSANFMELWAIGSQKVYRDPSLMT